MITQQTISKQEKKLLNVKLSFNPNNNRFFIDFWDIKDQKYLVSVMINENEALGISRDTGIKILEQ